MSGEFWALLSATAWAMDSILVRKGIPHSTPSTAALLSFSVASTILCPYVLFHYPLMTILHPANLFFVLSGLIQPALVRILFYIGIIRLGVSRAGPIRGTTPLFSLIIAFFWLHERPGALVYGGALLTIIGIWLVSYRRVGEATWRTVDLWFPLTAATLAGVSQNIRKTGLLIVGEPVLAATVTTFTSLIVLAVSLVVSGKKDSIQLNRKCLPYYGGAAFVAMSAQLMTFVALDRIAVSVASPLLNTTPLFLIAFTALFLRDVEKINLLVVAGVLLLVAGIALIAGR